jgi:sulfur-carrier protein
MTLRTPPGAVKPGKPVLRHDRALVRSLALADRRAAGYNSPLSSVTPSIQVKVLFFGRLKEVAGGAQELVEVTPGSRIEELFASFVARRPELARFRSSLVASRNQEFAAWSTPLQPGDEIAFLPPVSGG